MADFQEKILEAIDELKYDLSEMKETLENMSKVQDKICKNTPAIKKVKKVLLPGEPKRPLSSWLLYTRSVREAICAENPGIRAPEISKMVSTKWNALDVTEKQKFTDMAAQDKAVYNTKLKEWKDEGN
uniref:HMG box domain-containing protein n=1 Tax=viral metagenome TaxID=1070528 RepID=A0A6C0KEM4_9ZZZZ